MSDVKKALEKLRNAGTGARHWDKIMDRHWDKIMDVLEASSSIIFDDITPSYITRPKLVKALKALAREVNGE